MKFLAIVLLSSQLVGATLVMADAMRIGGTDEDPIWTDGVYTWTGNSKCAELELFPVKRLIPASELYLPENSQDTMSDEIGACRRWSLVAASAPQAPATLEVQ